MKNTLLIVVSSLVLLLTGCSRDSNHRALSQLPETDIEKRKKFFAEVRKNVMDEKFDWLETTANELQTSKRRFPGGDWRLRRFYEAATSPADEEKSPDSEWETLLSKLRKWGAQKPDSVTAQVLLAATLNGYGWKARGSGWAGEVTEEGEKLFSERSAQAEDVLIKIGDRRSTNLNWYDAMHVIAKARHWELDRYNKYFDEAVKLEPLYWDFYQDKAVYLMPRWYGEEGDWEKFAEEASNKIGGTEGDILYSAICWQIRRYYKDFYEEHPSVSYERVKRGFVERERKYGVSYRYLNAFCLMAGEARDVMTVRALLNRIGENREPDFWSEKYFEEYKVWAGIKKRG